MMGLFSDIDDAPPFKGVCLSACCVEDGGYKFEALLAGLLLCPDGRRVWDECVVGAT